MRKHKGTQAATEGTEIILDEAILQDLLPRTYKLELNAKTRMVSLLSADTPHIIAQQRFTKNEWSILIVLFMSYPHYAPYEMLLASVTSLSPADCRKRIQKAQLSGSQELKRELKPVYRAVSGVRIKLSDLSPSLKVSLIRDLGYALTSCSLNP